MSEMPKEIWAAEFARKQTRWTAIEHSGRTRYIRADVVDQKINDAITKTLKEVLSFYREDEDK